MSEIDESSLLCTHTEIGLATILSAHDNGLKGTISHIAFGSDGYEPSRLQTDLKNERARIALGGGEKVSPHTLVLQGLLEDSPEFWCKEIGIFLDDGTLLAVWSHPQSPRWFKSNGISVAVAYTLTFDALPAGAVTLNITGPSVNILFVREMATVAAALADLNTRQLKLTNRIEHLETENARLSGRNVLAATDVSLLKSKH